MNYSQRRKQLFKQMKKNEMALFMSGNPVRNSADSDFEFSSHRNYYYLTGLNEPEGVLMLIKRDESNQEILFIRDINPQMEKWIGRFIQPIKAKEISQVEDVRFISSFQSTFEMMMSRTRVKAVWFDFDRQKMETRKMESEKFYGFVRENYPGLKIKNSNPIVNAFRTVKDEEEVERIKEAAEITNQAIEYTLKNLKHNQYEYEVMADFLYILHKNNATEMFDTIMASGENGPILHYIENNAPLNHGDLILFDLGAKKNGYGADISRTYPISGKFSERQKELYNVVLEAMEKVTQAAKPGVTLKQLNQIVIDFYTQRLPEVGLTKPVSTYYYHSVSHFLGLDTHDVGQIIDEGLVEGNVITNEPGLYVADENIGIRIETDLLITKEGCEDLAPQIMKRVEDIESYLSER